MYLPRKWAQTGLVTDQEHVIRVRAPRTPMRRLIITLLDEADKPRPDVAYVLTVGEASFDAKTNANGRIDHYIPVDQDTGTLQADRQKITLHLNQLESIETDIGVQKRLNNLGYDCGLATGEMNGATADALRDFQSRHELEVNGECTPPTRAKLKEVYGH